MKIIGILIVFAIGWALVWYSAPCTFTLKYAPTIADVPAHCLNDW